jgi:hypothetical protein
MKENSNAARRETNNLNLSYTLVWVFGVSVMYQGVDAYTSGAHIIGTFSSRGDIGTNRKGLGVYRSVHPG